MKAIRYTGVVYLFSSSS